MQYYVQCLKASWSAVVHIYVCAVFVVWDSVWIRNSDASESEVAVLPGVLQSGSKDIIQRGKISVLEKSCSIWLLDLHVCCSWVEKRFIMDTVHDVQQRFSDSFSI